ncbi:MAG: low molecular weight phosphotyrosine protein phosphatase [Bacteroidia bacterium]|nr:low molecular weight phosphotyrosine protein phosphatase [Bacteroidia bacterium]
MKHKILFVCLGNICRSAVAEGILLHLIEKNNADLFVDSAGTSNYHIGEAPDKRTILNAKKHQIDISSLRARQFQLSDFDNFDKIYVMDKNNLSNVLRLTTDQRHHSKVDLLLNLIYPEQNFEVPDPYYGGEQGFEDVFQMVYQSCEKIISNHTSILNK